IFGGRTAGADAGALAAANADLERCRKLHGEKDNRIKTLEAEVDALKTPTMPEPDPEPLPVAAAAQEATVEEEAMKPATLAEARGDGPDDLKRIKGIGPKLEKLCFSLGFYHFDQIASWTPDEVAWVDANLEGFKGRVTRDDWVPQAKLLAEGGETAFSKKVDSGDVYDA
ncbi:MAG: hypothetical protein AAF618_04070, partial [Pseudomonadota bacterium]